MREERVEEVLSRSAYALEGQTTLGNEYDAAMSLVTLMKAERDSANAQDWEVFAALRRNLKAGEDKKDKLDDSFMKVRELIDQGRKVAVPMYLP